MTRTNSPTGWLRHATANSPLLYRLNIHRRLTLCFILVIVLMLVGDGVLLWQLHLIRAQVERLNGVDEELIEVLRVHTGLLSVYERLSVSARSEDSARLQKDSETLRTGLLDEVQRTQAAFNRLPPEVKVDPTVLPTLESIERTLPSQLDAIRALAASGEWEAVRYRLERQVQPLESLSSELLKNVAREVGEQRTQAALNIARAERRMFLAVPITGFLTLLIAAGLGIAITRSITEPLRRLVEGSKALARGEFQHQVPVIGEDELAHLSGVFNEATWKLRDLYDTLRNREETLRQSEERLRTTIDTIPTLAWVTGPDGSVEIENKRLRAYHGLPEPPKGEERGWGWTAAVHPDDRKELEDHWRARLVSGEPGESEARLRRFDGEYRWFLFRGSPLRDERGNILKWYGTNTDIHDRKLAEDDLRRSRAYLAEAQKLSRTGSFGWSIPDGELFWSDETFRITGIGADTEPSLERILQQTHPEDRAMVRQTLEHAFRNGTDFDFEHRLVMAAGSVKYVHVVGGARAESSGKRELVGAVMDVTAAKLALQEIQQLKEQLFKENLVLREEVDKVSMFEEIVGTSPALQAVIARVSKVAPTDSAVLITGETGTGKELIARAIHKRSRRSARAFVSVNCGAISAGLVESELFGHVKGAFTGAIANRDGRFKVADGGTILLDEVGDLPPETQVKLLRVLQEHEFEPIGCNKTVKVDVRLIAATNRNLEEDVRAGKFRSDLLYRLNVFPIHVPPLRERREDVPLLVAFLLQTFSQKLGKSVTQVRQDTMRRLMEYSWPGNVRELQNILERAVILSTNNVLVLDREFTLGVDDARAPVATEALWPVTSGASSAASASLRDAERRHIESALAATNWVIEGDKGAARNLDIHPNTLRSRMKKLDIHRPCGEAADGESAYRVKPPS
jgi:formate hydrogenlyase transcriptional activator